MVNSTSTDVSDNFNDGPVYHFTIAVTFSLLMVVGLFFNVATIYTYRRTKCLHKPMNVLITGCAMCDIVMILLGFPILIASCFSGRWTLGDVWCEGYAFITNMVGCTNVCVLVAVALDRYYIILEKRVVYDITNRVAWIANGCCLLVGVAWAVFPLLGWGEYVIEHSKVSCGPDWGSKKHMSYNIGIIIGIFVIPVIIIAYCYINILFQVFRKRRTLANNSILVFQTRNMELEVALSVFLNICSFMLAWLPYTALSLWSMIHDVTQMSATVALMAPLMAKSSSVWNPMVYVLRNRVFRKAMLKLIHKPNMCRLERAEAAPPIGDEITSGNYVNLARFTLDSSPV